MSKTAAPARLLGDENTSHRLVAATRRLDPPFPIVHIATWQRGAWLGLDDTTLLIACAEARLTLVASYSRSYGSYLPDGSIVDTAATSDGQTIAAVNGIWFAFGVVRVRR